VNRTELKDLAAILSAIADGAEWECFWASDGWGNPVGRDIEYCISHRVPIRLKERGDPASGGDLVRNARLELFESIEEIAQATGLLREAYNDLESNNSLSSAKLCADDALEIVSRLEAKFSGIAANLAKWIAFEEDGGDQ
jgi:hypothetical protein